MAFSYTTFEDLAARLIAAREWFEQIGLATADSRLQLVQLKVSELLGDLASIPRQEVVDKWTDNSTYWTLADALSFCEIAEQFSELPSHLLPRRKLATILTGPLSPLDENPSDASVQARNILAELELAANLAAKGLIPLGFDDLHIRFHDRDMWFECKRIHSSGQLATHVKKATTQLTRAMPGDTARGFIVVVLDRLTGVDRRVLRIDHDDQTLRAAHEVVEAFLKEHGSTFRSPVDTRIVGLGFILHFLVYSVPRHIVGIAFNLAIIPYVGRQLLEYRDRQLLESLAEHLSTNARRREPPNA